MIWLTIRFSYLEVREECAGTAQKHSRFLNYIFVRIFTFFAPSSLSFCARNYEEQIYPKLTQEMRFFIIIFWKILSATQITSSRLYKSIHFGAERSNIDPVRMRNVIRSSDEIAHYLAMSAPGASAPSSGKVSSRTAASLQFT